MVTALQALSGGGGTFPRPAQGVGVGLGEGGCSMLPSPSAPNHNPLLPLRPLLSRGVPWCHSGLGIQGYHPCGLGCCFGTGSNPGLGTHTCMGATKKKKLAEQGLSFH